MIKIILFIIWLISVLGWLIFGIRTIIKERKDKDWLNSFLIMQVMYIISLIANLILRIVK